MDSVLRPPVHVGFQRPELRGVASQATGAAESHVLLCPRRPPASTHRQAHTGRNVLVLARRAATPRLSLGKRRGVRLRRRSELHVQERH